MTDEPKPLSELEYLRHAKAMLGHAEAGGEFEQWDGSKWSAVVLPDGELPRFTLAPLWHYRPKPNPRTWWAVVNKRRDETDLRVTMFDTLDVAKEFAGPNTIARVKIVEGQFDD